MGEDFLPLFLQLMQWASANTYLNVLSKVAESHTQVALRPLGEKRTEIPRHGRIQIKVQ